MLEIEIKGFDFSSYLLTVANFIAYLFHCMVKCRFVITVVKKLGDWETGTTFYNVEMGLVGRLLFFIIA